MQTSALVNLTPALGDSKGLIGRGKFLLGKTVNLKLVAVECWYTSVVWCTYIAE